MATVPSPITHANQDGGVIQARYAFLLGAIRRRLREAVTLLRGSKLDHWDLNGERAAKEWLTAVADSTGGIG